MIINGANHHSEEMNIMIVLPGSNRRWESLKESRGSPCRSWRKCQVEVPSSYRDAYTVKGSWLRTNLTENGRRRTATEFLKNRLAGFYGIFLYFSGFFDIFFGFFGIFRDFSGFFDICKDVSIFLGFLKTILGFFGNFLGFFGIFQEFSRFFQDF